MNDNLKARKLKTKGILLYFGNDEEAIEVGEYIDNLQSKIDKVIEYVENHTNKLKTTRIPKIDFNYNELLNILKENK